MLKYFKADLKFKDDNETLYYTIWNVTIHICITPWFASHVRTGLHHTPMWDKNLTQWINTRNRSNKNIVHYSQLHIPEHAVSGSWSLQNLGGLAPPRQSETVPSAESTRMDLWWSQGNWEMEVPSGKAPVQRLGSPQQLKQNVKLPYKC